MAYSHLAAVCRLDMPIMMAPTVIPGTTNHPILMRSTHGLSLALEPVISQLFASIRAFDIHPGGDLLPNSIVVLWSHGSLNPVG